MNSIPLPLLLLRRSVPASPSFSSSSSSSSVWRFGSIRRPSIARRGISVFGYTQAKALVYEKYGAPSEVLRLHSHSISPAYGEEITVKFLAAPINPADLNQIQGVYPAKPTFTTALSTPFPIAVGGNEGVVQILSTGSSSSSSSLFKPGDLAIMRHTSFGTWRTHASALSKDLLKIPASTPPIAAATVSVNPCTAYRMLRDFTTLESGDWFVQNGANSSVGRTAIQFGKIWGFRNINIIRDREGGVEALKEELKALGADVVVTEKEVAEKGFREWVKEVTGGKGVKLGLNCVGGNATTNLIRLLGSGAHLVTYGAMAREPLRVPASAFIFQDVHMHGFWVSAWSDKHPEEKQVMLDEIFGYIKSGDLKEAPYEKVVWRHDTPESKLVDAVKRSEMGIGGKKVFVFED